MVKVAQGNGRGVGYRNEDNSNTRGVNTTSSFRRSDPTGAIKMDNLLAVASKEDPEELFELLDVVGHGCVASPSSFLLPRQSIANDQAC